MSLRKGTITLLITTLFLVFAGQTLAVAGAPCPMSGDMSANVDDMSAGMDRMAQDDMECVDRQGCHTSSHSRMDLCQMDGSCLKNSCTSAAISPASTHTPEWHSSSDEGAFIDASLKQAAITSLYRPPISR